jgi:hypothetical protein
MIAVCVRFGTRYGIAHVEKLRNMIERHSEGKIRIACITDQKERVDRVEFVDAGGSGLEGWWAKMLLFRRDVRDIWKGERVLYFDLDTVICGSLLPFAPITFWSEPHFAICENFTRRHGNKTWPCRFGSCVMMFGERMSNDVWKAFQKDRARLIRDNEVYGDQRAIELLCPKATLLQDVLPQDFLISYRSIRPQRMIGTSVINFGGSNKPDNCTVDWVKAEWQ